MRAGEPEHLGHLDLARRGPGGLGGDQHGVVLRRPPTCPAAAPVLRRHPSSSRAMHRLGASVAAPSADSCECARLFGLALRAWHRCRRHFRHRAPGAGGGGGGARRLLLGTGAQYQEGGEGCAAESSGLQGLTSCPGRRRPRPGPARRCQALGDGEHHGAVGVGSPGSCHRRSASHPHRHSEPLPRHRPPAGHAARGSRLGKVAATGRPGGRPRRRGSRGRGRRAGTAPRRTFQ